jgi:hypothetical protein
LDAQLSAADKETISGAPDLARQVQELEAEIDAAKVEFRFVSVGHRQWADLMAAHPPTREQKKLNPRSDHNPETFPVAAIAASCQRPELSVEEVQRLERALNDAQFNALWAKCLEANLGGLESPKSAAAGLIARLNVGSGTIAASGESLEASSSDE